MVISDPNLRRREVADDAVNVVMQKKSRFYSYEKYGRTICFWIYLEKKGHGCKYEYKKF